MMNLGTVEIVLLIVAVVAALWVLRPTPLQGQNVLQRWGIAKPTEHQGELAAALFGLFGWVGPTSPWRRQRLVEASA